MKLSKQRLFAVSGGFTLIELLLVIVIISTLAVGVFVALNPVKRLRDSRDARRTTDVNTYLTGIHQHIIDNKGSLPAGLSAPVSQIQIGSDTSGCAISNTRCTAASSTCYDLQGNIATYLKSAPLDPGSGTEGKTGYAIDINSNNMVTITACYSEGSEITAAR